MILLPSIALALTPTHGDGVLDVGSSTVEHLAVTSDGEAILAIDRTSQDVYAVLIDSWETVLVSDDCGATSVASGPAPIGEDGEFIFVGCASGQVYGYELVDETVLPLAVIADDPSSDQVVLQLTDQDGNDLDTSVDAMIGAAGPNGEEFIWLYQKGASNGWVNAIVVNRDGQVGDAAIENFPMPTIASEFAGAALQGSYVHIIHDGQRNTNVSLSSAGVTPASSAIPLYSPDDVERGLTQLWMCDTANGIVYGHNAVTATNGTVYPGMGSPEKLGVSLVDGGEWMAIAQDDTLDVYEMANGLLVDSTTPDLTLALDDLSVGDILVDAGRGFVGRSDGTLQILTAHPWIGDLSVAPADALPGETVEVSFTLNEAATWDIYLGGDRSGSGTELTSGSVDAAGGSASVTIDVTEDWVEGDNLLYVLATGESGEVGHGRVEVLVDTPPGGIELAEGDLVFGEESLTLSFEGIEDEDLAHYLVYVSDVAFESSDYPTGGPDGPEDWEDHPLTVEAESGERVSVELGSLVNDVTYYVAVRSVDSGGLESAMSNVISNTPQEVLSAAEVSGETGGSSCATGPGPGAMGFLVGLGALVLRSRRLALGGLLLGSSAVAAEDSPRGDMTPQNGSVEVRFGPMFGLQDDGITTVYGEQGHQMLQVEFGPQLTRFFEIDVGMGYYRRVAKAVNDEGEASSVQTSLTLLPLNLSATARLHIVDEQLIVPYARLGMDYVYYADVTGDDPDTNDRVSGSKVGYHYGFGASLLLDIFAPGRASLLEAQTGINDTYLTFEYRRQNIDSRKFPWSAANGDGFDFSTGMLTVGLKLDF